MGNTSSKGPFSFAMLVYQSVTALDDAQTAAKCLRDMLIQTSTAVHLLQKLLRSRHVIHCIPTHEDMEQLGILINKNHFSTTLVFQIPGLFRSFGVVFWGPNTSSQRVWKPRAPYRSLSACWCHVKY